MSKKKLSKKKIIRLVIILVVIIAIIAAACYTIFIAPNLSTEEVVFKENTVEYGKLESGVTESGTVSFGVTSEVYDLDISTDDDDDDDDNDDDDEEEKYLKVEEVYVAVGQRISEGDAIYKFTDDSIEDVRKSLTYAKTEAQIALAEAQTEYQIGILSASLSMDETNLSTSLAQSNYDNTVAQIYNDLATKTLEIEQLLVEIRSIQEDLVDEEYTDELNDVVDAYNEAIEDLEDASDEYFTVKVSANETFRKAREAYEKFFDSYDEKTESIYDKIDEIYDIQEEMEREQALIEKDLLEASQTLETETVSGNIADTKYASQVETYENSLNSAQEDLDEATEKLEAFEEFVGDGVVYSTGAGIITELGYDVDDYLIMTGTLFSYATADAMTISVDVSQEDVVTMAVGDSVKIVFSAYEDETYEGIIESITTTATSRSSATISYPVVISIQGDTSKLYGGMTADVTFVTEETEEVTYVSRKAIVEENGKKYVYVKDGNDYTLTQVTTGLSTGEYVEITSGLNEGDTYYIRSVITTATKEDTSTDEDTSATDSSSSSDSENFNMGDMPSGMDGGMPSGGNGGQMQGGFN